jgi:hypothetical protein
MLSVIVWPSAEVTAQAGNPPGSQSIRVAGPEGFLGEIHLIGIRGSGKEPFPSPPRS